jgi:hypothetical protein
MPRNRMSRTDQPVKCRNCGKLTRSMARGDCTELCGDCFEMAGLENAHSDGDHADEPCAECPECKRQEVERMTIADEVAIGWSYEGYWNVVLGSHRNADDVLSEFDLDAENTKALDGWLSAAESTAWKTSGTPGDIPDPWKAFHVRALDELGDWRRGDVPRNRGGVPGGTRRENEETKMINERMFRSRIQRIVDEEARGAPVGVAHLFCELASVPGATLHSDDAWSEDAKRLLAEAGYARLATSSPSDFEPDES